MKLKAQKQFQVKIKCYSCTSAMLYPHIFLLLLCTAIGQTQPIDGEIFEKIFPGYKLSDQDIAGECLYYEYGLINNLNRPGRNKQ